MNNFIIRDFKTKDIDRSGYFENINIGFKSTIIDIQMFIFDAEGETTAINSFLAYKIDPITHEICNTITLDSNLIKLHTNGYFYLDKSNLPVLFDVDSYYYLEISNGNKTWNSQIFQTIKIPIATLTINSFVAYDYIQGIDTKLSATFNATVTDKGLATFNFTWDFGTQQVTTTIQQSVSIGDTVILNPEASAPSGVVSGSYILTVSGSVSGSTTFNYIIPIVIETSITDYTTQTSGVTLYFGGNVVGKWIDQPSKFNFVSNNENLRTYTANGTYNLLIYGDIQNITKIVADNSYLSKFDITAINKDNTLDLKIYDNQITEFNVNENQIFSYLQAYNNQININILTIRTIYYAQLYNNTRIGTLNIENISNNTALQAYNAGIENINFIGGAFSALLLNDNNLKDIDLSNIIINNCQGDFDNNQITNFINAHSGTWGAVSKLILQKTGINNNINGVIDLTNTYTLGVYAKNMLNTTGIKTYIGSDINTLDVSGTNVDIIQNMETWTWARYVVDFSDCNMTAAEVNENLYKLDQIPNIQHTLTIYANGTNAAVDATSGGFDGLAAINSLVAKGATVNHN